MSLDLEKTLQDIVEQLERTETLAKRHEIFTALCQSWGLKPGESIQLLMEITISMAVDSKQDEASSEELLSSLNSLWEMKMVQTRRGLAAYHAAQAVQAAKGKPEGHC